MYSVYHDKYLHSWSSENGICFQKIFQTTLNKWWEVFCSVSPWWCCGSLSTLSEHICSFFPPENQLKGMRNLHCSCYIAQGKNPWSFVADLKLAHDLHDSWTSLQNSAVLPTHLRCLWVSGSKFCSLPCRIHYYFHFPLFQTQKVLMNSMQFSAPCQRCLLMQCENANGSNKFGTFTIFWHKTSLGYVIRMSFFSAPS